MATELEWLLRIHERVSALGQQRLFDGDALPLVEDALKEYPASVRLWNLRGDLIQMSAGDRYSLDDAQASYQHAIELEPEDPEAYESIGYFFDAVAGRVAEAEPMFRKAVELGGSASSWAGLARVLAQLGRRNEALTLLDPSSCGCANEPEVIEVRAEIQDGRWSDLK